MRASPVARPIPFARRFARDESGAVTVEAILWIPVFFVVLAFITDASLAFFAKAEAFRIVQNGNRLMSVGRLSDEADVEEWVTALLVDRSDEVEVDTELLQDSTIVSTTVTMPIRDLLLFNSLPVGDDWVVTVRSQHYLEWATS